MYQHTDWGANDRCIKNTSTKLYLQDIASIIKMMQPVSSFQNTERPDNERDYNFKVSFP